MASRLRERLARSIGRTIEAHRLWMPGSRVVVAVSGGSDSMALWHLLSWLARDGRWELFPVHVDHGLRDASATESQWLAQWFHDHEGTTLCVVRAPVRSAPGESVEMAARRVRHHVLHQVRVDVGAEVVAFGHQRGDQAETVLGRLVIGAGARGLSGIRPRQDWRAHPLLELSRASLCAMLREDAVPWLEDPTNTDVAILRNRLRHEVLPMLERLNPSLEPALAHLAARMGEVADFLEEQAAAWLREGSRADGDGTRLSGSFATLAPALQAEVLGLLGRRAGLRLNQAQVRQARERDATWPGGVVVRHTSNGVVWVGPASALGNASWGSAPQRLGMGTLSLPGGTLVVRRVAAPLGECAETAVNAERWPELWVRAWRPGDRLMPLGRGGHRKLKTLFQEARMPPNRRHTWPIVVGAASGAPILAVPGVAVDEVARVVAGHPYWLLVYTPAEAFSRMV